jgi:hypothetical protein
VPRRPPDLPTAYLVPAGRFASRSQ